MFLFLLVALATILPTETAYEGSGKVFFTNLSKSRKSGIQVIYRPENYLTYSEVGDGKTAILSFHGHVSQRCAKLNYKQEVLNTRRSDWVALNWDSDGNYYYHQQSSSLVEEGDWFGYAVAIYDANYSSIYEDINHFYVVPSTIEYCVLDKYASPLDKACSEVLEGPLNVEYWDGKGVGTPAVDVNDNAKGQIYFTHRSEYSESGVRIIYRPEDYKKYADESKGYEAEIGFFGHTSEQRAKDNYYEEVLSEKENKWVFLKWESEGNYFYYQQSTSNIHPGSWIGYGVAIYNADTRLVYEDINHFYEVPSKVEYCEPDSYASTSDTKCSEVFQSKAKDEQDGGLSLTYWLLIGVSVVGLLVIIGVVILCVKAKRRKRTKRRNQQARGASNPPMEMQQTSPESEHSPPPYQLPDETKSDCIDCCFDVFTSWCCEDDE